MSENINNQEILFIYDAKNSNPNGDMDNDNKPRYLKNSKTNLVSDVRIKRYVRDYINIFENKEGQKILVNNDVENVKKKLSDLKKNKGSPWKEFIDIRFFGAVLTEEGVKGNDLTGPIQFTYGYSLNEVDLLSHAETMKTADQKGIHSNHKVKYSFIAHSATINSKNANIVELSNEDVNLFDKALINGFSILTKSSRSKIGQIPRLYLRIKLIDDKCYLKDLREYISLKEDKDLNDINDVKINYDKLAEYLGKNEKIIEEIAYYIDDIFEEKNNFKESLNDKLNDKLKIIYPLNKKGA